MVGIPGRLQYHRLQKVKRMVFPRLERMERGKVGMDVLAGLATPANAEDINANVVFI